ncbi:MAG: hypothetical protein AAFT19_06420 [Pseudomonadota bacterium]
MTITWDALWRGAAALILAIALCARPGVGAAALSVSAPPGMVAICAGGQIIYVVLEGFDLPEAEAPPAERADPCPAFAFAAAPAPPPLAARPSTVSLPAGPVLPAFARPVPRPTMRSHPPRAPPAVLAPSPAR